MRAVFVFSLLITSFYCSAQHTDKKLYKEINKAIQGFHGDIGIYIKNLRTGKTVSINADTIFPTASIVKVPILLGIMDKIERGELQYTQPLIYKDSLLYPGSDILGSLKHNERISLSSVIMLMMTMSDNTASLWLQSLAGYGTRINEILDTLGFKYTRVNSRTPGRFSDWQRYGWGQTTPDEMGNLLEMVYRDKIFSVSVSDRMKRCMTRNIWDWTGSLSQIPPGIAVYSKNGSLDSVRSEAMVVNAPHNPYVFCFFTKNNMDPQWSRENEAWTLARKISAMVWNYFEPKSRWTPPLK